MIAVYIIIGISIGAAVLYVLMDRRMDVLRIASAQKDVELKFMHQQLEAAQGEQLEEQQKRDAQFMNMAQEILERSASKLKESNTETMSGITQPLKDAISEMRKAINDNTKDHTAQTASLKEQLRLMMETGREMSEKAEGLANVLRRDNKISGNMGEIILGDLLASQGLTEGIHYEVQARLRDEQGRPLKNDDTGREMQPDVILHYPQGQDAIVDSKVSLVAYEKYVNAETPEDKERYLQDHIKSVRSHVNELARKDYSKYIKNGRETVDLCPSRVLCNWLSPTIPRFGARPSRRKCLSQASRISWASST